MFSRQLGRERSGGYGSASIATVDMGKHRSVRAVYLGLKAGAMGDGRDLCC